MHCYVSDMPPQSRRPDLNLSEDGVGVGGGGVGVGGISSESGLSAMERVQRLAEERAVVVFSISTCCMCHVVKRLLCGLGVNPTVHELDEVAYGHDIKEALGRLLGVAGDVPAVFVGGRLIGSLDRVMAAHISGALVPLLKEAGALWL